MLSLRLLSFPSHSIHFLLFYKDLLYSSQESDYVKTLNWQRENFPQDQRLELIMYSAENVLTADYVREVRQGRGLLVLRMPFLCCLMYCWSNILFFSTSCL